MPMIEVKLYDRRVTEESVPKMIEALTNALQVERLAGDLRRGADDEAVLDQRFQPRPGIGADAGVLAFSKPTMLQAVLFPASFVLVLYALLLWRAIRIAALAKDPFGTYVAAGSAPRSRPHAARHPAPSPSLVRLDTGTPWIDPRHRAAWRRAWRWPPWPWSSCGSSPWSRPTGASRGPPLCWSAA